MPKQKGDAERRKHLAKITGLDLDPDVPAKVAREPQRAKNVSLAPPGVDPHTMPVSDIVFDPALLDEFPSLEGQGQRAAADHVFALYKSPGRNKDRNSLLWSRVGKFIVKVRSSREPGGSVVTGHVKEEVKATREQRDLAALLTEHGITAGDLAGLIKAKGEAK